MAATTPTGHVAKAAPSKPGGRLRGILLARRASRGDRRAFEQIFERHHQELFRYCLAILRDRHDAEDALQATMAAALAALPGEERDIDIRPWLFRIAHNESVSLVRGRRPDASSELEAAEREGASQDESLETRDRIRRLVSDLGELPERQSSALVMRELSGLSYAEIGGALACSEGGARQAVFEARTALREREEGREMECDAIRRAISDGDGRRLRGRKVRAHLKGCDGCRGFAAAIPDRRADLQSLSPPLTAAAAGTMLSGLMGGFGGGAATGAGAAGAGVAGGGLAASAAVKGGSLAAAVVLAAGAADVGGLIDIPNPVGGGEQSRESASPSQREGGGGTSATESAPSTVVDDARGSGAGDRAGRHTGDGRDGGGRPVDQPGDSGNAPAAGSQVSDSAPSGSGSSETAPGQTGTAPGGGSADAPGQTGELPGNASNAPGHSETAPGNSGAAPGQTGSEPPGQTSNDGTANGNGAAAGSKK